MDKFFIGTVVSQRKEQDRGSHEQIFLPQCVARIILLLSLTLAARFTLSFTFYIYLWQTSSQISNSCGSDLSTRSGVIDLLWFGFTESQVVYAWEKILGKSMMSRPRIATALGGGNSLIWIFFVKDSVQLGEYYFLLPCSHFPSIFLYFQSGSFLRSVFIRQGRQVLPGISLSTCFSLFCQAEICAFLSQREPEGYGHSHCERTSPGLFDTHQIPESSLKSLLTTSAAPQGRSFVLLSVIYGILQLPAVKAIMPQAFLSEYVSLIIAFPFSFPKSSAL